VQTVFIKPIGLAQSFELLGSFFIFWQFSSALKVFGLFHELQPFSPFPENGIVKVPGSFETSIESRQSLGFNRELELRDKNFYACVALYAHPRSLTPSSFLRTALLRLKGAPSTEDTKNEGLHRAFPLSASDISIEAFWICPPSVDAPASTRSISGVNQSEDVHDPASLPT
jgi:hypothetical protein